MSQLSSAACYTTPPEIYLQDKSETVADLVSLPPLHGKQSICFGNAFSPRGGSNEWNSNELLLKDECLRKLAYVSPLDCDITRLYYVNPVPKL